MKYLLGFSVFAVACGGTIAGPLYDLDGGNGTDGTMTNDGSMNKDGSVIDAADKCAVLKAAYDAARDKALTCCPQCNVQQCDKFVDDLCCQISVSNPDRQEVKDFETAMQAYRSQCGPIGCPALLCPMKPSLSCGLNSSRCTP